MFSGCFPRQMHFPAFPSPVGRCTGINTSQIHATAVMKRKTAIHRKGLPLKHAFPVTGTRLRLRLHKLSRRMCLSACLRHFRGDYDILFNGKVETITLLTQMFPLYKMLEFALDCEAFQRGELAAKML